MFHQPLGDRQEAAFNQLLGDRPEGACHLMGGMPEAPFYQLMEDRKGGGVSGRVRSIATLRCGIIVWIVFRLLGALRLF